MHRKLCHHLGVLGVCKFCHQVEENCDVFEGDDYVGVDEEEAVQDPSIRIAGCDEEERPEFRFYIQILLGKAMCEIFHYILLVILLI